MPLRSAHTATGLFPKKVLQHTLDHETDSMRELLMYLEDQQALMRAGLCYTSLGILDLLGGLIASLHYSTSWLPNGEIDKQI